MNKTLECAIQFEQNGDIASSAKYYTMALRESSNDMEVLYFCAVFLFNQKQYADALDLFIKCYRHEKQTQEVKQEILQHIFTAYYEPNAPEYEKQYLDNKCALSNYEHNYLKNLPDYEGLRYLAIPRAQAQIYIFDKVERAFLELLTFDTDEVRLPDINLQINDIVLIVNQHNIPLLKWVEENTRDPLWVNNLKVPLYVIWDTPEKLEVFLQVQSCREIISLNRMVFFSDCHSSEFQEFFRDSQALIPNIMLAEPSEREPINKALEQIDRYRTKRFMAALEQAKILTKDYTHAYYKKLFGGDIKNIKILFYTCRFTQVVQYVTRDFLQACKQLGMDCEILIEKSDIHRASNVCLLEKIANFKPNIVFRINFFRIDFKYIPDNMLFVTWMQDPGGQIKSVEHAQKFGDRDFAIGSKVYLDEMVKTGFDGRRCSVQDVPVDDTIFFPCNLTQDERTKYAADIALPSNYSNPEDAVSALIMDYNLKVQNSTESIKEMMTKLCVRVYDVMQTRIMAGELMCNAEHCGKIIDEIAALLGLSIDPAVRSMLADRFFLEVSLGMHRKATLRWLIDSGFKVNLWGRNWEHDYYFKQYANGVVQHGSELAKMYSASKIILATFSHYTGHFRVFESLCCGALPFLRYVPKQDDMLNNFRNDFEEDRHFVFYYSESDLISKLKFYLSDEDARRRIVENGRRKTIEVATYNNAARRFLSFLQKQL